MKIKAYVSEEILNCHSLNAFLLTKPTEAIASHRKMIQSSALRLCHFKISSDTPAFSHSYLDHSVLSGTYVYFFWVNQAVIYVPKKQIKKKMNMKNKFRLNQKREPLCIFL